MNRQLRKPYRQHKKPALNVIHGRKWDEYYGMNCGHDSGPSYGYYGVHKRVLFDITGVPTQKEAHELAAEEMIRRGWKFREKWWQFWRVIDPRSLSFKSV